MQFCERVQLDSICSNELADPDALVSSAPPSMQHVLADWRDIPGYGRASIYVNIMICFFLVTNAQLRFE